MRWNSFTIIGIILILVGIFGLIKGPTFQFDPGTVSAPYTWFYYVAVGVLMIINGILTPIQQPVKSNEKQNAPVDDESVQPIAKTVPPSKSTLDVS
jgi:uncharacterized membrane protein